MLVQKKAREVMAYCLGSGSDMERRMMAEGKIRRTEDGSYRVFSQENSTEGQIALPGDYFKIDSTGTPYPNDREFFLKNHTHIREDLYLQTSPVLKAWSVAEEPCPEIEFLLAHDLLQIDPECDSHYFGAFLWGAWLHAARDAVIIFDSVEGSGGIIENVEFHFITREEFGKSYQIL